MNDQEPTSVPTVDESPQVSTTQSESQTKQAVPIQPPQGNEASVIAATTEPVLSTPSAVQIQGSSESISKSDVVTKKRRAKWFVPAITAAVLLVIGGGAYGYMGIYMQSPENIWKSAMNNTGDALTNYISTSQKTYSGGKISGTLNVTSPTTVDGTLTGSFDAKNATYTVSAGALGVRATAEVRSVTTEPATSPDIYVKVGGLKSVAALLGTANQYSTLLTNVEDQWYFVDHTLTAKATSQVSATTESPEQLQKDIQDVATKVNSVFQDYIFTTDQAKAVVIVKAALGKEDFKGRPSQKYLAQVRKQQLKDMVTAVKDTLKQTKVNNWVVGTSGKTFEQQVNSEQLMKDIDALPEDKLTAEVWVDTGLKYIRNVRITLPNQKDNTTNTVDFMMDYTGGENVPLTITSTTKDATNNGSIQLGITLHKNSSNVEFELIAAGAMNGQRIDATVKVGIEPTNDAVAVTKPDGAKNIMELLGGVLGANTDDSLPADNSVKSILQTFSL